MRRLATAAMVITLVLASLMLALGISAPRASADNTYQALPFSQNWSNTGMITALNDWSGVPGIIGYRGDNLTGATGTDPQTLLADGGLVINVIANQSDTTQSSGGVAEFDLIANPVIALNGSGTADAPYILIHVDTTGLQDITVSYNLRDLDGSTDNAVQPVALQYRVGGTGSFTNVPAGFVADATSGPSLATLVTPVSAVLPANANNQAMVQIRIITANAVGNDEWVGIDDILIAGSPPPKPDLAISKSGPAVAFAGDAIAYDLYIANTGGLTATGTIITDVLPSEVAFVTYTTALAATFSEPTPGTLVWDLGDVPTDAADWMITVQGTVDPGVADGTLFTNTVSASTTAAETVLDNNSGFWVTQVGAPDLAVVKNGPGIANAGEAVAFTLSYSNTGTIPATGVVLVDLLPDGMIYVADSASGIHAGGIVNWTLGAIDVGASGSLVVTATANLAGTYTNTAAISGSEADIDFGNNLSEWPVTFHGADPFVFKSGPSLLFGGDVAAYTITYGNGGSAAANVTLTDTLPAGFSTADIAGETSGLPYSDGTGTRSWTANVSAGTSLSFTLSLTVPTSIASGTRVTNTAEIASPAAGNDPGNDRSGAASIVYQIVPVAAARAGSAGQVFAVQGTVTAEPGIFKENSAPNNRKLYLQDGTGGILVYRAGGLDPVARDRVVRVIGSIDFYRAETEFLPALTTDVIDYGAGVAVSPLVTTTGSIGEAVEGQLVQVAGTVIAKSGAYPYPLQVDDGSGMVEITLYTNLSQPTDANYVDFGLISVGDYVRISGLARGYEYTVGGITTVHQEVLPRGPADVWRQPTGFVIGKTAPESVLRNGVFTYTLSIKNDVGGAATGVLITDAVPLSLTVGAVSDGGEVLAGNVVSWTVNSMALNATITRTIVVTAPAANATLVNADYGVFASEYMTRIVGLPVTTRVVLADCSTCQIQGAVGSSPYVGQVKAATGVIYDLIRTTSSAATNYYGFFIQAEAGAGDGDPASSDGLYVYMGTATTIGGYAPARGDRVIITGTVAEVNGLTQLTNPSLAATKLGTVADLDAAVPPTELIPLDETNADNTYRETLESMRVIVPAGAMVVAPTYYFASTNDTEFYAIRHDHPVALRADPFARRVWRDGEELDNGVVDGNSYRISVEANVLKGNANDYAIQMPRANVYDVVSGPMVGALTYAYSRYTLMVESAPVLSTTVDAATNAPPAAAQRPSQYAIATMNVENLYDYWNDAFDTCDFGGDAGCAGVTAPFDYVPANLAAYQRHLDKLALEVIDGMKSPDIISVQESEDQDVCVSGGNVYGACGATNNADGQLDALQDLAATIYIKSGNVISYQTAADRAGVDYRGIIVGYLYRSDRVELVPAAELGADPVLGARATDPDIVTYPHNAAVMNPKALQTDYSGGGKLFERLPQVALFRVHRAGLPDPEFVEVYAIGNHFKSGPDTNVQLRTEQANYNSQLVAEIQAAKPGARVAVLGDLNVYPDSPQLAGLSGMSNLYYQIPANSRYTYTYQGQTQTLDQILVTGALSQSLAAARVAHVNADWSWDYAMDAAVIHQASDHDPVVATFQNLPPVAVNDAYTTTEDIPLLVAAPGILGNDSDAEGDPLTATLVEGPLSGSLVLAATGAFTYTPALNFNGLVTFTYQAGDGLAFSNVAEVAITVTPANDAPVAVNDAYTTTEDIPLLVSAPGILANDTDVSGDPLTATLVEGPMSGSLVLAATGAFTYTPALNSNGLVTFTYQAGDGLASSNVAEVAITVTPANDAPVAVNDAYTTTEDIPLLVSAPGILANDTDVSGDPLTATLVEGPLSGSLVLAATGAFTYTPALNFSGVVTFTYQAGDGLASSNIAEVAITVEAAPVFRIFLPFVSRL